eukprot:CAMPEP_0175976428 /NCGR_PEP_ID=MMETSP0108-20121206/44512_1 /TAXON_ID=195067 ORGANISM="Goniomonas pacifica, Strain CCMP1869" /NCGR_SAMPLE_ID=MMETSP0108 /ASSEMBLY_ACC=CAM_ASM_000204 /LENGTH=209 /DNA_ID=CAMNT_0017306321 /DNA_START=53 /DNA_END=683 /DNA_ORIENTATION=-
MVVLGDTGVGKTCIVVRYVEGRFSAGSMSTIGASFMIKKMTLGDVRVTLQIWDTAGQERFRSLAPMYYRGAAAAVLVFDVGRRESFLKAQEWVAELKKHADVDCGDTLAVCDLIQGVLAIACNKSDLAADQRQVSFEQAAEYAKSIGAEAFDTSAKLNKGIDELFLHVAKRLVEKRNSESTTRQGDVGGGPKVAPGEGRPAGGAGGRCC